MMRKGSLVLAACAAVSALSAPANAGTPFRLDIGRSFADRSAGKAKDAVLLVRGLACDDAAAIAVTGTAEGIVTGTRQSLPLTLQKVPTPGVFAVRRQWPAGRWVLSLTATCPGRQATASAIVPLDARNGFDKTSSIFAEGPADMAAVHRMLAGE